MRAATSIILGLLWLIAPGPAAVAQEGTPVSESKRITLTLEHVRTSTAMRLLFASVRAKNVIDPSVTGEVSVNVLAVAFGDSLRAFMDAADQPLRCTFKDGTYFVTVQRQPEEGVPQNRVGIVSLPPGLTAANKPDAILPRPEPVPFAYTTPDGSFRAEASKSASQFNAAGTEAMSAMGGYSLMDGTVVIRPLVPGKVLSVASGPEWTPPGGAKSGSLNLSPVRPMLFDTVGMTAEVTRGVVVLRDRKGRSVTVYPYFPETAPPLTLALYPDRPLSPEDTQTEKLVHQGEPGHQILWVTGVRWPTLTVYLPPKETATGAAVIICPGGGYSGEAMDLEGYDVARRFASYGVAGIVLKYRLPAADMSLVGTPWPFQDGSQAIRLVRDHARAWRIDPHRVGIMGFSAGGHLAASVATRFDAGDPTAPGRVARQGSRPDFLVLAYPVTALTLPVADWGGGDSLRAAPTGPPLVTRFSSVDQVTPQTPPTFLVQAEDDPVSVQNSILFEIGRAHV